MEGRAKKSARVKSLAETEAELPAPQSEFNTATSASEREAGASVPAPEALESAPEGTTAESAAFSRETAKAEAIAAGRLAAFAERRSTALARSQAAFVQGLEELSVEMAGLARWGLESATRGASEMLEVETFSDALDLQFSLVQESFQALVSGSLRMVELGLETAHKTAEPFLAEFLESPL